mgnify:CR=1 FL=1
MFGTRAVLLDVPVTVRLASAVSMSAIVKESALYLGEIFASGKGFAELQMEGHEARAAIAALNGSTQGAEMIRVGLKSEERPRRR